MTDVDMLDAVWQHATHEGLQGTFINVGLHRQPTVSLAPSYLDRDKAGIERLIRWARSIGASTVDEQHGMLTATGQLNSGTPVSVQLRRTKPQEPKLTVWGLQALGQVA